MIQGSHRFSLDLLKFLVNFENKDTSEGVMISPFSIWSSLIVLYMGSKGDTEKQLKTALRLTDIPKTSIGSGYQGLRLWYSMKAANYSGNSKYAYSVANKIFVRKGLDLDPCMSGNFASDIEPINFSDPTNSISSINAWVERMTRGKIKDFLSYGSLSPFSKLVIANAVYFKSQWMVPFDESDSYDGEFMVNPVETMNVTFMKQTGSFSFGVNERLGVTVVELPYATSAFSMIVLIPEVSRGVDSLMKLISVEDLRELTSSLFMEDGIQIHLPKFKMEQQFELGGALFSMGVKDVFDPRTSNLTGFFGDSEAVTVDTMVHKTMIQVNEEGTEAAAVTGIMMSRSGRPAFPTQIVVNRPFIFIIKDTATNVILFNGIVRRPNAT